MSAQLTPEQIMLGTSAGVMAAGAIVGPWMPQVTGHIMAKFGRQRSGKLGPDFVQIAGLKLTDDARMRHTHIVGATGTGKTVLMEQLLFQDLARGCGALIIEPKGERAFYERVKAFCRLVGREADLHLLSATYSEESVRWNPCRLGTVSELQSKFFCASKYEHSYYAKACELALLRAFRCLDTAKASGILLSDLVTELDRQSNNGKDENLKGLYFDIQNLVSGEWAPIIGTAPKVGNQVEVSLLDIIRRNEILFVDLPTEGKTVQSARVGSLLLQEITLLSGLRKRAPESGTQGVFSIFVDEFDAFATEPFVSFLNKGRSSRFMIHMAHQTLSDLAKVSPTFQGQIMGNPNVRFIFRMDVAQDAEMLAKQFGTKITVKRTFQTQDGSNTGAASSREVQEFRIHPDVIKELRTGECIVGIKTTGRAEKIRIPLIGPDKFVSTRRILNRNSIDKITGSETRIGARKLEEVDRVYGGIIT